MTGNCRGPKPCDVSKRTTAKRETGASQQQRIAKRKRGSDAGEDALPENGFEIRPLAEHTLHDLYAPALRIRVTT